MTSLPKETGPAPGTKYILGDAPCAGKCGRLTRSKHASAADHPGTVARTGRGMCSRCYTPILAAERAARTELKHPILKCTSCDAMTRSVADNVELAPGTRRRVSKGQCSECYYKKNSDVAPSRLREVQSDLDAFLRARRARGARFGLAS